MLLGQVDGDALQHLGVHLLPGELHHRQLQLARERLDQGLLVQEAHSHQRHAQRPTPLALLAQRRLQLGVVDGAGLDQQFAELRLLLHGRPLGTPDRLSGVATLPWNRHRAAARPGRGRIPVVTEIRMKSALATPKCGDFPSQVRPGEKCRLGLPSEERNFCWKERNEEILRAGNRCADRCFLQ